MKKRNKKDSGKILENLDTNFDKYVSLKKFFRHQLKFTVSSCISSDIQKSISVKNSIFIKFVKSKTQFSCKQDRIFVPTLLNNS